MLCRTAALYRIPSDALRWRVGEDDLDWIPRGLGDGSVATPGGPRREPLALVRDRGRHPG